MGDFVELEIKCNISGRQPSRCVQSVDPTTVRLIDIIDVAFGDVHDLTGIELCGFDTDGIELSLQSDADLRNWLASFTSTNPPPTCWFELRDGHPGAEEAVSMEDASESKTEGTQIHHE